MEVILAFFMIFLIGMLSLIGLFMISIKEKTLDNILFILVAFATGTILATALFNLIPEALHHLHELNAKGAGLTEGLLFLVVIIGFVVFFILERFIYWFHGHAHERENQFVCYDDKTESMNLSIAEGGNIKNFALLNLVGDALHNFLDGIVIMVGFLSGLSNGIIITLAVLFHELPQEVGDYGILLYGGFTKKKALLFNLISAMVALLGGLFAYLLSNTIEAFNFFFLAFAGGGFLYIASTELMPELLKEKDLKKSVIQTIIFLGGLLLIIILIFILPHE
ncbi:MAG: ZIP family metal transporter [Promethearchaeota archaeon]|nr:MAG: ZIP family metal transporter [Candidatus Lokiarchaeota archaeon]